MKILQVFAWLYPSYLQMNVAAIGAAAAVGGAAISSNASSKAAGAQSASADQANATQRYQYDQTREDNAPFRESGVAANKLLSYRLGISPKETTKTDTWNRIWNELVLNEKMPFGNPLEVDALTKETQRRYEQDPNYAKEIQAQKDAEAAKASDPNYGSLLDQFGQKDLDSDVIYQNTHQYAQDQGNLGVNRMAAASGSQLSGATLKALQKSGANIANSFGNDAFNRSNTEKTRQYNALAGVSGAGQMATNQVSSAGQNMANQVSNNQTALGNARGASAIAQGNAWGNALSTGANAYQQQSYMNSLNNFGNSGGYNDEMARLNSQAGGY